MAYQYTGLWIAFTLLLFLANASPTPLWAQHYAAPGGTGTAPCDNPDTPCLLALAVEEATNVPGSTVFIQLADAANPTASFTGNEAEDLTGQAALNAEITFDAYIDATQQGGLDGAVVTIEGDVTLTAEAHVTLEADLHLTGEKTLTLASASTIRDPGTLHFSGAGETSLVLDTGHETTPETADLSSLDVVIDAPGDASRVTFDAVGAGRGSASLTLDDLLLVDAGEVVVTEGLLELAVEDFVQFAGVFRLTSPTNTPGSLAQQMRVADSLIVHSGGFRAGGAAISVGGDFRLGSPSSIAWFDGEHAAFTLDVAGRFTIFQDVISAGPLDRTRFYLAGGTVTVAGDYDFRGRGDTPEQGLDGTVVFVGAQQQAVSHRQDGTAYFNDVVLYDVGGILLKSDVFQNETGTLRLHHGIIDSNKEQWTWTLLNPGFEPNLAGRNNAAPGAGVVQLGSPDSYVNGPVTRRVERGATSGLFILGGNLFPVGLEDDLCGENDHVFRPLIVQFPGDLDRPILARVDYRQDLTPENCEWPENGLVVEGDSDDTLTLDVLSDQFWQLEFDQIPSFDPTIRVEADGLPNVFDIRRLRLIQWDCDCTNPRLAGFPLPDPGGDPVYVDTDFIDSVPNLTRERVDVEACQILGIASNFLSNQLNLPECGLPLYYWQIIHNTPDASEVDVYFDDYRILNDTRFQTATPFIPVVHGTHTVDLVAGTDSVNSKPLLTTEITFSSPSEAYITLVNSQDDSLSLLTIDQIRLGTERPRQTEFFIVHSAPNTPPLALNLLDATPPYNVVHMLAQNLAVGQWTDYFSVPPDDYLVEVVNADDNTQVTLYRLDLSERMNETFILLASGLLEDGSFRLIGFDNQGAPIPLPIRTSVEAVEELPAAFTLHGNYPNPFNPTTTLRFDLSEPARISVEVIDLLGRIVMTTLSQQREAGSAQTMALDASDLASGAYLYRMTAQTAKTTQHRTGRMTVIK